MFKNEARSSNLSLFVCLFKYVCHNSSVNSNTSHKGPQEGRTQLVTGQAFMLPINTKDAKDRVQLTPGSPADPAVGPAFFSPSAAVSP